MHMLGHILALNYPGCAGGVAVDCWDGPVAVR